MQVVYISNRPAVLAETLAYVRHFLPWVTEAVVLTPQVEAMRAATAGVDLQVTLVADADLTSALPDHHQARNSRLRRLLYATEHVDQVFLQSDDDYRPLKPVPREDFVDAAGRLISYCFYELSQWRRDFSPYDEGQHACYLALLYWGAPTLAYASHMPQPMDKDVFARAFAAADELTDTAPFCEWTLPLNHGRHVTPELFAEPRVFRTLGWPQHPHEWPLWKRPTDIAFENFYPEMYEPGRMLAGLSTALDVDAPQKQAFAKMQRYYAFDHAVGRLSFPSDVDDPWTTSAARRVFFKAAKGVRKLVEYAALEERSQLTEMSGRQQPPYR